MAKLVSWDEVEEALDELEGQGLTLLIRSLRRKEEYGHRFLTLVAPQVVLEVDVDTPMGIPHRGGLKAVLERRETCVKQPRLDFNNFIVELCNKGLKLLYGAKTTGREGKCYASK